jgi:hypothetical protein
MSAELISQPLILPNLSTHSVKPQYRIFVSDSPAAGLNLNDALYEVYAIPSTSSPRQLWDAMKLYADSRNFAYFAGDAAFRLGFEAEIVGSSLPSTPEVVEDISEFLDKIKGPSASHAVREVPLEQIPSQVDCLVVGAGITGLLVAQELTDLGKEVLLVEKSDDVGGVWRYQANKTSRVNTSEPAYRLLSKALPNMDHTPTAQIMDDVRSLADRLSQRVMFRFQTTVTRVEENMNVQFTDDRSNTVGSVQANRVFMCVNRRLGNVRRLEFPNEAKFKGEIFYGVENDTGSTQWRDKHILIVGAGAFATENARTALELGAKKVTVLSRRRGSVCPLIVDYLNFIRPYDAHFAHDSAGSSKIFHKWRRAFKDCRVTEPECWQEGLMSPKGHTISVSDSWFVGHYYGLLETQLGEIQDVSDTHVTTTNGLRIDCDVIVKCTGFEKNHAIKDILGESRTYENGVVRQNTMYIAEAILDNIMGYRTPFGSSYVEAVKLQLQAIREAVKEDRALMPNGERIDMSNSLVSKAVDYMAADFTKNPERQLTAQKHVLERTLNYHRRFGPADFVAENKAEWLRLVHLFKARNPSLPDPPYPFEGMIESLAQEWTNPGLPVGNLPSLRGDAEVYQSVASWLQHCLTSSSDSLSSSRAFSSESLSSSNAPN